ncbi:hypothetical protein AVEN_98175-1 [Araneus ventricosus]|uniref:Uncharacterized protein n=1 Tax=Araneus ventricosus TaxID=182803 RepID=A0A4Y2BIE8_ARAVE|nr:hypothetical protein AVEN_98175-1 [Araneus ventricosus]
MEEMESAVPALQWTHGETLQNYIRATLRGPPKRDSIPYRPNKGIDDHGQKDSDAKTNASIRLPTHNIQLQRINANGTRMDNNAQQLEAGSKQILGQQQTIQLRHSGKIK